MRLGTSLVEFQTLLLLFQVLLGQYVLLLQFLNGVFQSIFIRLQGLYLLLELFPYLFDPSLKFVREFLFCFIDPHLLLSFYFRLHCLACDIYTRLFLLKLISLAHNLVSASFVRAILISKPYHLLILLESKVGHCGFKLVNLGLLANAETIDTLDITNLFVILLRETKDLGYLAHGDYARVHGLWRQVPKAGVGRSPGDLCLSLAFAAG